MESDRPILLPALSYSLGILWKGIHRSVFYLWKNSKIPKLEVSSMVAIETPPIHTATILTVLLFCLILGIAYIKIQHPFWNLQPVYHTYDFWRYFYKNPFPIHPHRSENWKTKFIQPMNVTTVVYIDLTEEKKKILTNLIQCYYKLSDHVFYTISDRQIDCYMSGHKHPSYISFYVDNQYNKLLTVNTPSVEISQKDTDKDKENEDTDKNKENNKDQDCIALSVLQKIEPIACMVSYPVYFFCTQYMTDPQPLVSNHWDFISVKREYKKKNIHRYLIQTHEYHVRKKDPSFFVSSFQKEYHSTDGIVPIVKYKNTLYMMKNIHLYPLPIPMTVNRIYEENKDILIEWLSDKITSPSEQFHKKGIQTQTHMQSNMFAFYGLHDLSTLLSLIQNHQYFVYVLKEKEKILALYFMKDTHTVYESTELNDESNSNILQLLSSVKISQLLSPELFAIGWMHCIKDMNKHVHKKYMFLSVQEISHNEIICRYIENSFIKMETSIHAFYLYNYFYPASPISPPTFFSIL